MPKWGLTPAQRKSEPWGLDERWLEPGKTITEPVHGDIYVTRLEQELLSSPPMQRLRRVRQLGTSHLVYPGATHSRFSHALGTLRASQDLVDAVVDGLSGPRIEKDHLLEEWRREGKDDERGVSVLDRRLAEATVLARLGGLLHDLCHIPLGHTIEDDLGVLTPHDANVARYEKLWAQIPLHLREALSPELTRELRALILSKEEKDLKEEDRFQSEYPFVTDIVGNTICADLIDYIQRDHLATGLPMALGNRFVNDFYVTSASAVHWPQRMVVKISRHGQLRPDVVTELVKYLRFRYELSERVLYHHAKTAADAMIGKLLEMRSDAMWVEIARDRYPDAARNDSAADNVSELRKLVMARHGEGAVGSIDEEVRLSLEAEFLRWSDDGLLEYLASDAEERVSRTEPGAKRDLGISTISRMVLNRELFKTLGQASQDADLAASEMTYKAFGAPERRRELEEQAARFAGVRPRWSVVLWVPSPKMRMKVAEVLVNLDGRVAPLADMSSVGSDANAIVEQHRRLWGVGVYGHPSIEGWRHVAVLAWLRDTMGLSFKDHLGRTVPTVEELLMQTFEEHLPLQAEDRTALRELVEVSGMGSDDSFLGRLRKLDGIRQAERIASSLDFPFDELS